MKFSILIIFLPIIILASIRGAVVYHIGIPANLTYVVSAFLLCGIGLLSTLRVFRVRECSDLSLVQKVIQLNVVLQSVFFITYIVLGDISSSVGQIYSFIIFPMIFILSRFSTIKSLEKLLFIIFLITVVGVVNFYFIGKSDMQELRVIKEILRPATVGFSTLQNLHADGSIERLPQGFGYQANHHDSSNILVMISSYYMIKTIHEKGVYKIFYFTLFTIGFIAILIAASASNVTVLVGTALILLIYMQGGFANRVFVLFLFTLIFLLVTYIDESFFKVLQVTQKFVNQAKQESGGMFNSLDLNSIILSLPCLIFGFGNTFKVPMVNTEIGFINILVGYGILPTLVFYSIIFMPLILIHRCRTIQRESKTGDPRNLNLLTLHAFPVIAGTMTLLHYGSLLRVTSIGLFCVVFSIFIKYYLLYMRDCRENYNNTNIHSQRHDPQRRRDLSHMRSPYSE